MEYNGVPLQDMYELWQKVQAEEEERRLRRRESMSRARAKYYEAHKEKHREHNKIYYDKNRDKISEQRKLAKVQASE